MPAPNDDRRSLEALRARYGERHRWWVLGAVMIANMAAAMAATTINVAVPAISAVFALGQQQAQWLATAFMGPMTLAMLTTPWLLQRYGYRRTTLTVVALLFAGGLAGGLAPSLRVLLAARVAEGAAAGVLQIIPGVVIMRAFAPADQGRAMGAYGFGIVLAPAIGPSVGGLLIEWFDWPAVFFFVLPFCVVAFALSQRVMPHSAPGGAPVDATAPRPDLLSLILLAAALAALLVGVGQLSGPASTTGWVLVGLAAIGGAGFVVRQRFAPTPLLPLVLFERPVFTAAALVSMVYGTALYGSTYLLAVFMVGGLDLAPSTVGAVMMPSGLALAFAIPLAGRWVERWPFHRTIAAGLVAMTVSFAAMMTIEASSSLGWIVGFAVLGRIGLGFVIPSLGIGAMRGSPPQWIAAATSAQNFLRQLGGVFGIGLLGVVLEWRLQAHGAAGVIRAYHEAFALLAAMSALAALAALRVRESASTP